MIGDIHGRAFELEALLSKLGYCRFGKGYHHDNRKVIFLGDFIDRGPHQAHVLQIVKEMVTSGAALAVMGNHEFNAIAYYTPDGNVGHLRTRNDKNTLQHRAFLDEFGDKPEEWKNIINWFKSLPLWLELDGLRVVHACWDPIAINRISEVYGDSALITDELLHAASKRGSWQYHSLETLLKGKEVKLPEGKFFHDKDGNRRHQIRIRWWDKGKTYKEVFIGPKSAVENIPAIPLELEELGEYGQNEKPVFIGHYWMEGEPRLLAPNIACLDYSVAQPGGKLVAYRWCGEKTLSQDNYVWSERID